MHTLKQLKNTFSNIICLYNISINAGWNSKKESWWITIWINWWNTFWRQSDSLNNNSIIFNQGWKNKIEKKEENMYCFELKLGDNFAIKIHNLATSLWLIPWKDHAEFFNNVITYFEGDLNGSIISETGKIRAGDEILYKNWYVQIKRNWQQINFVKLSNKLISIIWNDLWFQQNEEKTIVNKNFNKKAKQIFWLATDDLIIFKKDKENQILWNKDKKIDEQKFKKWNEHLLDWIFKDWLWMNDLDLWNLSGDLSKYELWYMLSVMQKDLHIWKLTPWAKKREQIIRSMEKAGLIKIIADTEIIFNTKKAIENLKYLPDVETLRESFGADIYKWSLESVVLVQLYLKAKWADISIDWKIWDETFDALRDFYTGNWTFTNNIKIKQDNNTLVDKKVKILASTELDERDIDAWLFILKNLLQLVFYLGI